ncbi:MAG TPA: hypothetical protein ENK73_02140, partial [Thiomicrospira sp.]|nr:hypothetical protein [Thiomicrospira sp.]
RIGNLSSDVTRFESFNFTYNNQFEVKLENIDINLDFSENKPYIQHLKIGQLSIKNKQGFLFKPTDNNQPSQSAITHLKSIIQFLEQPLPQNNQLSILLANIPNKLEIESIQYSQPCANQATTSKDLATEICKAKGRLTWQYKTGYESVSAQTKLHAYDDSLPGLKLLATLDLAANQHKNGLQLTNIDSDIHLIQETNNQTVSLFRLKNLNQLPEFENHTQLLTSEIMLATFSNSARPEIKTPFSLEETLTKLNQRYIKWSGTNFPIQSSSTTFQSTTRALPKIDFVLKSTMNLANLKQTEDNQNLWATLLQNTDINTKLDANIPNPVSINDIGTISGESSIGTNLKHGFMEDYQLNASGQFALSPSSNIAIQMAKYNVKTDPIDFKLISKDITKRKLTNLSLDIKNTPKIPIDITLTTRPGNIPKNEEKQSNKQAFLNALQSKAYIKGEFDFQDKITFHLLDAQINLKSPAIKLNETNTIQNARLNFNLNGNIQADKWHVFSTKGQIKALFKGKDFTIKNGVINWQDLKLSGQSNSEKTKQSESNTQILNAKGKSLSFTGSVSHKLAEAENVSLNLKALNIKPIFNPKKTALQALLNYKFDTQYKLNASKLIQANLIPQSWKLFGQVQGELLPSLKTVKQLNLQGRVSNKSGFVVFHNLFYTPNQLAGDWEVPPIYFLAGNSLQNTFKNWPKLLTLGSGSLQAKSRTKINLGSLNSETSIFNNIDSHTTITTKGISGIYNETTLNQLDSKIALNLNKSKLSISAQKLEALQLNHGVIIGPISVIGDYQTTLKNLYTGIINLKTAKSELFTGQAWLAPQTIDLSKPFASKLQLTNIDLNKLLQQYPSADIQGRGLVDGELPFKVDLKKEPAIAIPNGHLKSQVNGGLLKYQPTSQGLKQTHQSMTLVLNVLEDFHYSLLSSNVTYGEDKKIHLNLKLRGSNPAVEDGRQVHFNIQLEEDLPALITSMQISNQVSETIKKRIQEKLQK